MITANQPCATRSTASAVLFGMCAALLALPVNTATAQSFPNYPLLTGREGVAPNILFILDDSGSMRSLTMGQKNSNGADDTTMASDDNRYSSNGLSDNPVHRSYVNNSIYYDPKVFDPLKPQNDYRPWMKADGSRMPNANIKALSPSVVALANEGVTSSGTRSLVDHADGVFYVPKAGVSNPGTDRANYTRYWVTDILGQTRVVRAGAPIETSIYNTVIPEIDDGNKFEDFYINVTEVPDQLRFVLSGGKDGNGRIDVYRPGRTQPFCSSNKRNDNNEECVISKDDIFTGSWLVRVINTSKNKNMLLAQLQVFATKPLPVPATPSGRSQEAELQNIANWYQYHRTRIKVAKAGASEAFSRLGDTYRIGFDTIWNRNKGSLTDGATGGNAPSFPIPVGTDKGLFKGANRSRWFEMLHAADANQGTPLHGALTRAGKYYTDYNVGGSNDPWSNGDGSKALACRASYGILTTDGFWNNSSGFSDVVGDSDGDGVKYTLADVAMYYYKNDLRTDITNNLPADSANRRHQRMTVFGVSIGLSGTLSGPPNAPPTNWPDPWPTNSSGGQSWDKTETARRIDDLWHAAVNTEGTFVVASRTEDFANALANAFKTIDGRLASGSNLASNGPQVTAGSVKYSAIYHSNEWWGDMRAFPRDVSADGYSDIPTWKLSEVVNNDSKFTSRPVLSSRLSIAGSFKTLYASDTRFQRTDVAIADNLAYLTGVRTLENGTLYRVRKVSPIGDIVNSSPVFANDSGYLFVGANDGMLHGINAANGQVAFSYVPQGISMDAMASLSNPSYEHRFMVDGQIAVSKIRESGDKNYLVGTLGRGGKGVFALDVSDPAKMTKNQVVLDATFQSVGDLDMGYVLGNVAARRLQSGKMVALVPNGYESSTGSVALFMYDLENGKAPPVKLFAELGTNNGLMVVEPADFDADGRVDVVYGGDLKGNVWRWDFRGTDSPTAKRIFTAVGPTGLNQPITGGLTVVRDGSGQIFVAFGTGRLITENDLPWNSAQGSQPQTIYGIIDNMKSDGSEAIANAASGATPRYSELKRRTIPYVGKDSRGRNARSFELYSALPDGMRGWYVDLGVPSPTADTERVVSAPVAVGRALWIDTVWPARGDGCEAATGDGYMNALDIFTGTNTSRNTSSSNTTGTDTFSLIDVDADGTGNDRLSDTQGMSDSEGYVTSVSHGAYMGRPDVTELDVCTQLDDGRVVCVKRTADGAAAASRLMWRELFRSN